VTLSEENVGGLSGGMSSLHRSVTGRDIQQEHWRWRYLQGPGGPGATTVAVRAGKVIGSLGSVSLRFVSAGRTVKAALLEGLAIVESERSWSIYRGLLENTTAENVRAGVELGYSFVTRRGADLNRKLGWSVLGRVPVYAGFVDFSGALHDHSWPLLLAKPFRIIQPLVGLRSVSATGCGLQLREVSWGSAGIDHLRSSDRSGVVKDAAYLRWRYERCPNWDYRILGVFEYDRLEGYTVIRALPERGELCLLEMVASGNCTRLREALLAYLTEYAQTHALTVIRASFPVESWQAGLLRKAGFQGWTTLVAGMYLAVMRDPNGPSHEGGWEYSLGDWIYF
jgi:hypothetical protein